MIQRTGPPFAVCPACLGMLSCFVRPGSDAGSLDRAIRKAATRQPVAVERQHWTTSSSSLELHLQFVNTVVDRYKQLVELVEVQAITWQRASEDGGGIVNGAPIVVMFSREIEDVGAFADELTSSREPFRLWGLTTVKRDVAEVEAVDLHVGQTLQMDITRRWMRIYLSAGSCGNTVARLISNLQHPFDGALSLRDPQIDIAARRPLVVGA
ncbi:hypothetical protein RB614_43120 [Phytohabitans sp. ZYX-F-186]|uniref:Uncharacterized protein n=1 Tax=Phytohabitans maris TaxID=3071409 RepID=A0ABU0ZYC8_9ACTN|nr:hypothetical protein [Phytohabitans sp. ZYX-F-186]MDQ7911304.1 hypothetical protein [Phytohabitans sp. ZYX-F-186]